MLRNSIRLAAALLVVLGVAAAVAHLTGGRASATTPTPTATTTSTATATATAVLTGAAAGQQLFVANCSICHGANAAGGYTMGGATSADLRWASLGPMYHNNVSLVTGAILNGKDQAGNDLDAVMPRWQGTLNAQQTGEIITYLQTLTTDAPANQPLAAPSGASPGEVLFYQNCTVCHGADASGGKQVGPSATSADLRWTNLGPLYHNSTNLVAGAILNGKDQDNNDLDPAMPRWSGTLTTDQANQIVAFLQTQSSGTPVASSPTATTAPATATATPPPADLPTTSQVSVTLNEWKLIPAPSSVHYGTVHFNAINSGAKPHNFVVIRTDLNESSLPLTADGSQVDTSAAGQVVGTILTSQLQPGTSATATFDLAPGRYVLICNVGHHYTNGMHAAFTVTKASAGGVAGLPNSGAGSPTGHRAFPWWPFALAAIALVSLAGAVATRRRA